MRPTAMVTRWMVGNSTQAQGLRLQTTSWVHFDGDADTVVCGEFGAFGPERGDNFVPLPGENIEITRAQGQVTRSGFPLRASSAGQPEKSTTSVTPSFSAQDGLAVDLLRRLGLRRVGMQWVSVG